MSRRGWDRRPVAAIAGAACCAVALLLTIADPRAALVGWLGGFALWSGVPIGALALVMMMRLLPGPWRDTLRQPGEAALLLLPLAAVAALPVLIGLPALYDWAGSGGADETARTAYRAAYLDRWTFSLRTVVFFAVAIGLAALLLTGRGRPKAVASAGLIGFVLLDTTMAVDWLMSLDPDFHASGFGLYILANQITTALLAMVSARLLSGDGGRHTGILGGLMLTMMLFWGYFAFMQYFIIWSGNLPQGARWYQHRNSGLWAVASQTMIALHMGPAFLLLFPPIRHSRRWLAGLCGLIFAGKLVEMIWLVVPEAGEAKTLAVVALVSSVAGLGLIGLAACAPARRWAERQRQTRETPS
ncbi:hypothetical protein P7L78_04260 (plasmid) [Tistrella bauzanensis]|uniref:Uncharacterized protein n=1 Tax=Tistrella arctica TaxID=3133430 RepID=A0ABU9YNT6_9PROT